MSEALEIKYFGQGFSKGKNGKQIPRTGWVIGSGEPIKAWLRATHTLIGMGYDLEDAFLRYTFKKEWENFKNKL